MEGHGAGIDGILLVVQRAGGNGSAVLLGSTRQVQRSAGGPRELSPDTHWVCCPSGSQETGISLAPLGCVFRPLVDRSRANPPLVSLGHVQVTGITDFLVALSGLNGVVGLNGVAPWEPICTRWG